MLNVIAYRFVKFAKNKNNIFFFIRKSIISYIYESLESNYGTGLSRITKILNGLTKFEQRVTLELTLGYRG